MRKLVITLFVALVVFMVPAASFAGKVVLPEDTEIKVKFDHVCTPFVNCSMNNSWIYTMI